MYHNPALKIMFLWSQCWAQELPSCLEFLMGENHVPWVSRDACWLVLFFAM